MSARALACLTLLLAACSAATRSVSFEDYPPRPAAHPVEIFVQKEPVRPYEEIGFVSCCVDRTFGDVGEMMDTLRAEARKLGGDAIVGLNGSLIGGEVAAGDGSVWNDDPVLSGTVIRYSDG